MAYAEGYADGSNKTGEIVYTYHTHGDGHCTSIPVYHSHSGNSSQGGGCYNSPVYCGGPITEGPTGTISCDDCGKYYGKAGGTCSKILRYNLSCGKTPSTIEKYVCDISEGTILSATIVFN